MRQHRFPNNFSYAAPRRRVAVLVDTSTSWGRGVIQGIHQYALQHHWHLFLEPLGVEQQVSLSGKWSGDGVIARIGYSEMASQLRKLRIPVVNVSSIVLPRVNFPRVTVNLTASAKLAAAYFLDRGFRHFAYLGIEKIGYVARHQQAFDQELKQRGCASSVYTVRGLRGAEPDWQVDASRLKSWLLQQPKPLAMLTWNAGGAREVLYACQSLGLPVPEEVAVLSGSEDDLLCELAPVPLSGIVQPGERIGIAAVRLLDRMMHGEQPDTQLTEVAPDRIVTRRSTETFAVKDPVVLKGLLFIHDHASSPIQVRDVARSAAVSRRILERHFRDELECSPGDEIRRAHIQRAAQLLTDTRLSIADVAQSSGFTSPEYFAFAFHRSTGSSPLEYRKAATRRRQSAQSDN